MNCIRNKCKYFYESDTYCDMCELANQPILSEKCIGISNVKSVMEKLVCQIGGLLNKYDDLFNMESYIKDNQ